MQHFAWSQIRQNPVTCLVAARLNPANHEGKPIKLLDFDERRPRELLHFSETTCHRVFWQPQFQQLLYLKF